MKPIKGTLPTAQDNDLLTTPTASERPHPQDPDGPRQRYYSAWDEDPTGHGDMGYSDADAGL